MKRIILANCVVLCAILFNCYKPILTLNYELSEKTPGKPNTMKEEARFWLGRKKRSSTFSEEFLKTQPEPEQLEDMMKDVPWAIVAINEGKRHTVDYTPRSGHNSGHTVNYTPRLGRESAEDYFNRAKNEERIAFRESPPLQPRLGRRGYSYSPRLGREKENNYQKYDINYTKR